MLNREALKTVVSRILVLTGVFLLLLPAGWGYAQESSDFNGHIKLSYSTFEQEGKKSTAEEVYNLFSGFALGSLGFNASFMNGSSLNFTSSDLNLGNRSLGLDFRRTNWLNFEVSHRESRFLFGEDQTDSRRKTSSAGIRVNPLKHLKLFANYKHQQKEGDRIGILEATPGVLGGKYDQFLQSGQLGFQLNAQRTFLGYSFRILDFDSRLNEAFDRRSYRHKTFFSSSLVKDFLVSLQYLRDDAKLTDSDLELDTDLYTLALLYRAIQGLSLSGKFFYQNTENQASGLASKTFKTSYNVGYDLNRRAALEAGYEYERRKDQNGKNHLNSFLIGARGKPLDNLKAKVSYLKKKRQDKDFSSLVGPYDSDNFLYQVQYQPIGQLKLDLKYQDRQRDNEEILTFTDSKGLSSYAVFIYRDLLTVDVVFSMLDIEDQDSFGRFFNKTRNFLVTGTLEPIEKLTLKGGLTYLRVKGDLDLQKLDLLASVAYNFWKDLTAEVEYKQYNYDDYLIAPDYFTLNVFTVSVTQKIGNM
jgi:hypothetical protein